MIDPVRSSQLSKFARALKYGTWLVASGLIAATAVALAVPEMSGPVSATVEGPSSPATPLIAAVVVGLVVFALQQLGAMLQQVEVGEIFGPGSIRCFKRFATALLVASAIAVVAPWAIMLAGLVEGEPHRVTFELGASDALLLLVSVVLLLVAHLMEAAAIFETDSRGFL